MRVSGGIYRGRTLKTPDNRAIRPTSDKIRQALFNMVRSRMDLSGITVLDAFCGTGALGIEAISQGAGRAVFIDRDKKALDLARANCKLLGIAAQAHFIKGESDKAGQRPDNISPAHLVFLDPPYRMGLIECAFTALVQGGWMAPGALVIMESEKEWAFAGAGEERFYGDTKITLATWPEETAPQNPG